MFAAPQLTPAPAWGNAIYGVDAFNSALPFSQVDLGDSTYWSSLRVWTQTGGPWVYWTSRRASPNSDYYLWRTNDYATITAGVPPTWAKANFDTVGRGLDIGGHYRNGKSYFGVFETWPGGTLNVGYSTSADNGVTWSGWTRPQPDWRAIPAIAASVYDDWGDPEFSYDMVVDANGRVHFFGVLADTATTPDERALVEIYETATGWDAKFVSTDMKESTRLDYGGLEQMGHHLNAAISADGNVMAIFWLDAGAAGDTLPDIWFSFRSIGSTAWSAPQNLTATPTYAELLLQVAPTLRFNGGNSYTAFISRAYETGVTTYPPNDIARTDIFFTTYTFSTVSVRDLERVPTTFRLDQNFPNPFNPSTKIQFAVPSAGQVTVKVFDMIGREVATLVNDELTAGSYEVNFDASQLSSGVYVYKMQAGTFVELKKMVLAK